MLKGKDGASFVFKSTFKVLVVDHNKNLLNNVSDFLKSHSFEVTWVEEAGAALRLLALKKDKFDLLLIDSELRDVDVATFLRLTRDMNILSMVMREEADDKFVLKMFKNGAFLVIKRPLTDDAVFQARQHVIRDRIHKFELFHHQESSSNFETESGSFGDRRRKDNSGDDAMKKFVRNCYIKTENNSDTTQSLLDEERCRGKKKICLEWTEELHAKFLRAVHKLGEGNCLPRAIVDTMGVPGLTRMQVASHLQKCREDGWNYNAKRGEATSSKEYFTLFSSNIPQGPAFRRFGRMPLVARHLDTNQKEERNTTTQFTYSSTNGVCMDFDSSLMNNHSSHDSSSLMNGHDEFQDMSAAEKRCDPSLMMNGFGLQNSGQVFSLPCAGESCSCYHVLPPNQASHDHTFFDFGNDIDGNNLLSCMQMQPNDMLGTNYDSMSTEQINTNNYDQVIPNEVTCNNEISQEVGQDNV